MNDKLKELIKKEVKSVVNEISQTGNIAGYQTPYAFSDKGDDESKKKRKKRLKKMNDTIGYTLVNDVATPEAMQDFYAYFHDIDESELNEIFDE